MPPDKAELRRAALARRDGWTGPAAVRAATAAADHIVATIPPGNTIAGYFPIGTELDPRPALQALAARGDTLALPVAGAAGTTLRFRRWRPGEPLVPGPFGTSHPPETAAIVRPDVLLVPLVAFDRAGQRLGYGAGYYDRTIAALKANGPLIAWGLAYEDQEVGAIPAGPHDVRLDGVITERRVVHFGREPG
ncbi:MAG: 5-formyltetrahydrofolate cyclo-ligase [Rhodospirillaceae bacterium]|nr:5-formyltetrahydrofolate cyclo-ligase [Rhodospirillaceae bacterium]